MGGEDDVAEDDEAHRRREEGCRREESIGVAYLFPSSPFGRRLANDRQSRHPQRPYGGRRAFERLCETARLEAQAARHGHQM